MPGIETLRCEVGNRTGNCGVVVGADYFRDHPAFAVGRCPNCGGQMLGEEEDGTLVPLRFDLEGRGRGTFTVVKPAAPAKAKPKAAPEEEG